MKILITGCNGQLGNEMQLLEAAHKEHQWLNTDVQELDLLHHLPFLIHSGRPEIKRVVFGEDLHTCDVTVPVEDRTPGLSFDSRG